MKRQVNVRLAIFAVATFGIAGCASMSKDECRAIDWRTAGYEDGATGQGIERLSSRRQACAKHGVSPDLDAYRAGREEGLLEFCQPANGFRVGATGRGYSGACPQYLAEAFLDAYETGRYLHRLERQVSDTVGGINARRAEIGRIDEVLVSSSMVIVGAGTSSEERAQALLNMKNLTDRRALLLVEIDAMERALPAYQAELDDYRRAIRF